VTTSPSARNEATWRIITQCLSHKFYLLLVLIILLFLFLFIIVTSIDPKEI
jgi:hypothetical protein